MSAGPARVVLLAHPAAHSLSPRMHDAAFAAAGVPARYAALDVPPAELATAVARLRAAPYLGANVSVPHKEAVARLVDELTGAARAVGAVNTVVRHGARLVGHNTDAPGFLRGLAELGFDPAGAGCLVLGAGGAARAVVWALLGAGARVVVVNRDAARAERLVADLEAAGAPAGRATAAPTAAPHLPAARLLVNTTSVGMAGGPDPDGLPLLTPAQLAALPAGAGVVDLVYRPALTPLLRAAAARGHATQNGLPMLLWQGALAFEAWTGRPAPAAVMREALERGLAGSPA